MNNHQQAQAGDDERGRSDPPEVRNHSLIGLDETLTFTGVT